MQSVNQNKTKQYKKRKLIENITGWGFLAPYFLMFLMFFVFPFIYGIYISFFDWNLFNPDKTVFVGFKNFYNILFNTKSIYFQYFWTGLRNTVVFVIISVPLLIFIPLILAILIENEPKGFKFFRTVLFMPTVFSISAVVLIWRWQFNSDGFINSLLGKIGMDAIPFLTKQPWAWISILIVTIWWTMGTNMVIFGAGIKGIDKSVYEAASIDGASEVQTFFKITLPSLKPQIFLVGIMTMLASFNIYGQPEMLTDGGPNFSTTVLMMRIRALASGTGSKPGVAAAMALLLGIIMIIISIVQIKITGKQGEH